MVAGVETPAEVCEALNTDTAAVSLVNATLYDLEQMRNGSESLLLTELEKMTQDYICVLPTTTPEEVQIGED